MVLSDKTLTLCLNKNWLPIGVKTVGEAICCIYSKEYLAIDIFQEDGEVSFNPCGWNEWINLPIREDDLVISSVKLKIKIPTVILTNNYSGIRKVKKKLSNKSIMERDNYTCQYSGKKFSEQDAAKFGSIDHIIPKSRNGDYSWENLVFCDKEVNIKKANRTPEEAGLKLLKKPSGGLYETPFYSSIKKMYHKNWNHFIIK